MSKRVNLPISAVLVLRDHQHQLSSSGSEGWHTNSPKISIMSRFLISSYVFSCVHCFMSSSHIRLGLICWSALLFAIDQRSLPGNYTWWAVQYADFTWIGVARSIGVSRYICLEPMLNAARASRLARITRKWSDQGFHRLKVKKRLQ